MRVTAPFLYEGRWYVRAILLNLPDEDPDQRVAWLKEKIAPYGFDIEVRQKDGPVPTSPTQNPLFEILVAEAKQRYHVPAGSEMLYSSTSDCRYLRRRGIACYGVSPYLVDITQSVSIHGPDERIRLDWFQEGIEYLRSAVRKWSRIE